MQLIVRSYLLLLWIQRNIHDNSIITKTRDITCILYSTSEVEDDARSHELHHSGTNVTL